MTAVNLFTVQMSRWRQLKAANIELIDTTVKTGERAFAPTWDLVLASKANEITPAQYTEQYLNMMRQSYHGNREVWDRLLLSSGDVAIACYCTPGAFCHRHILKDVLEKVCVSRKIPFFYYGEFT